jgi:hypothetical protein
MSNKVLLKKSSVVGKVPATTDLDYGEVALNYADGLLYYKSANNVVQSIGSGGGSGGSLYVIPRSGDNVPLNISGILSVYDRNGDVIQVVA